MNLETGVPGLGRLRDRDPGRRRSASSKSRPAKLILICGAFAAAVAGLAFVAIVSMQILSAARGYTQGEALWSKGQKDALLYLTQYARTRSEADYRRFRASIAVPLSCRSARQQMDRPQYDEENLRRTFAEVGIQEQDRNRMVWLYRHFRTERHLAKAVSIWTLAEDDIARLQENGERLHQQILSDKPDETVVDQLLSENDRINVKLTTFEAQFSDRLAEAGRWLHSCLITILSVLAAVLIVAGSAAYYILFSRITNSEHKYRHLIDTASEAILIASGRSGKIVDANHKAVQMLGPQAVDPDANIFALLAPGSGSGDGVTVHDLMNLIRQKHEARLRSAAGAEIDVEFSASLVDIHRRPLIALIVRDVTEQKKAAEATRDSEQRYRRLADELRIARDRALDATRMKSEFLTNMSHEIRTPMNGVLGMISLALDGCSDPKQKERLDIARNAGHALLSIINDILDLSKIEAGKLNIEAIDFDLRECLEQALQMFTLAASEKRLRLDLSFSPDAPVCVRGDPVRLRQVIVNLVGNSIKFTEHGGTEVCVSQSRDGVQFEVRDTGIGIPADKLDTIFDAFTQADGSHTRQYGGSGLGLTITRRLVELMGGRIWAESVERRGSSFFVQLPMPARPAAKSAAVQHYSEPVRAHALPKLNVLVAEDNRINQKVMSGLLENRGCTVTLASNGSEAYEKIRQAHFDLVLMDVQMPEMDGFEATRLIREDEKSAPYPIRTPIIAVTAHASGQHHDQCIEAGMDAVVTKPVDPAALWNVIGSTLGAPAPIASQI